MPKQRKYIAAGPLRAEVLYSVSDRRQPDRQRAARCRASSEAQRLLNMRHSRLKLEFLLAANFGPRDLFVTLTFDDAHLPRTPEGARRLFRRWIADLRVQRRRRGLPAPRYVYVIEGRHGEPRLHVHVVLSATGPRDLEDVVSLWPCGAADLQRLDEHGDGPDVFDKVSRYMCKERAGVGAQSWTPSKNLCRPEVSSRRVPDSADIEVPADAEILEQRRESNVFGMFAFCKYVVRARPSRTQPTRSRARPGPSGFWAGGPH